MTNSTDLASGWATPSFDNWIREMRMALATGILIALLFGKTGG
jgi:hypothetical protein